MRELAARRVEPYVLVGVAAVATLVSAIRPHDALTWFLEAFPVLVGLPLVLVVRNRFPLTPLVQRLLVLHALGLLAGAHYTYARVPAGDWVRDALGLDRNPYDRFGHFVQGFVPALVVREVLLRTSPLRRGGWLRFLVVSVCLAISAFYELIEWWAAVAGGHAAEAFLGTQGDIWDTQWDIATCLVGAILALLLLSRTHDRQLERLQAGA
ncbi:MAG: DUF2238 domain-containing protein [Planctomycetota bacterium]